jgi:hypothetical protein
VLGIDGAPPEKGSHPDTRHSLSFRECPQTPQARHLTFLNCVPNGLNVTCTLVSVIPFAMGAFFSWGNRSICSSNVKPCSVFLPTAFSRADMCSFFLLDSTVDPCNAAPRLFENGREYSSDDSPSRLLSTAPAAAASISRNAAAASSSPGCRCVK